MHLFFLQIEHIIRNLIVVIRVHFLLLVLLVVLVILVVIEGLMATWIVSPGLVVDAILPFSTVLKLF